MKHSEFHRRAHTPCCLELSSHTKSLSTFPPWGVVLPIQYHCDTPLLRLPCCVVHDPPTEVPTIVGVHPVSVDVMEAEILRSGYVERYISAPALPARLLSSVFVRYIRGVLPSVRNFIGCIPLSPAPSSRAPGFSRQVSLNATLSVFTKSLYCKVGGTDVGAPSQASNFFTVLYRLMAGSMLCVTGLHVTVFASGTGIWAL